MEYEILTPGQARREKTKQLVVEQLKKLPIVQLACEKISLSRSTYYRWRKEDERFTQETDEALLAGKQLVNDLAESQLISAIRDKNITAIIFWLKNHHNDYKTRVELSGNIKTDMKLTPEQEDIVRKALELASLNTFNNEEHYEQGTDRPADS